MKKIGQSIFIIVAASVIVAILAFGHEKYDEINQTTKQANTNKKTIIDVDSSHVAKNKVHNTLILENRSEIRRVKNGGEKRDSIIIASLEEIVREIKAIKRQTKVILKHNKKAAKEWEQFNLLMSDK